MPIILKTASKKEESFTSRASTCIRDQLVVSFRGKPEAPCVETRSAGGFSYDRTPVRAVVDVADDARGDDVHKYQ